MVSTKLCRNSWPCANLVGHLYSLPGFSLKDIEFRKDFSVKRHQVQKAGEFRQANPLMQVASQVQPIRREGIAKTHAVQDVSQSDVSRSPNRPCG